MFLVVLYVLHCQGPFSLGGLLLAYRLACLVLSALKTCHWLLQFFYYFFDPDRLAYASALPACASSSSVCLLQLLASVCLACLCLLYPSLPCSCYVLTATVTLLSYFQVLLLRLLLTVALSSDESVRERPRSPRARRYLTTFQEETALRWRRDVVLYRRRVRRALRRSAVRHIALQRGASARQIWRGAPSSYYSIAPLDDHTMMRISLICSEVFNSLGLFFFKNV